MFHQIVLQASNLHRVPSGLIHAIIQKESGYYPGAKSKRNARGLMQLMPNTARFVGAKDSESLYDPQTRRRRAMCYERYAGQRAAASNTALLCRDVLSLAVH